MMVEAFSVRTLCGSAEWSGQCALQISPSGSSPTLTWVEGGVVHRFPARGRVPTVRDMLIPLVSVSLIGLIAGAAGLTRRAPAVVLYRCLLAAWLGFAVGAVLGLVVDVFLFGGFWLGLFGHVGAVMAASRTSQVSAPTGRRSLTG